MATDEKGLEIARIFCPAGGPSPRSNAGSVIPQNIKMFNEGSW